MLEKPLILVADDEDDVRALVCLNFRRAGFDTGEAADGLEALRFVRARNPDALILDVMMPGRDGLQVCEELRSDEVFRSIPIVLLTARGDPDKRVAGLEKGADDCIAKPFSPKELVLRVQAVLRRSSASSNGNGLEVGPFHFDRPAIRVSVNGEAVDLTLTEFKLLHLLASHHRAMLDRGTILREVWGDSIDLRTRTLDTHIKRLREKLGSHANWIQTGRGSGYVFQHSAST